jgi:hypothetical protein
VRTVPTSGLNAHGPAVLTSWAPPGWAEHLSTEGDLVEAFRVLGSVPEPPRRGDDVITVIVVQRDEIQSTPTDITVRRHPAEILVGGVSLTGEQAGTLIELLSSAISLTEATPPPSATGEDK